MVIGEDDAMKCALEEQSAKTSRSLLLLTIITVASLRSCGLNQASGGVPLLAEARDAKGVVMTDVRLSKMTAVLPLNNVEDDAFIDAEEQDVTLH